MSNVCKGDCKRYALENVAPIQFYKDGRKRCIICDCWFKYHGNRCLCCSAALRLRRRHKRDKICLAYDKFCKEQKTKCLY